MLKPSRITRLLFLHSLKEKIMIMMMTMIGDIKATKKKAIEAAKIMIGINKRLSSRSELGLDILTMIVIKKVPAFVQAKTQTRAILAVGYKDWLKNKRRLPCRPKL